VPVSVDQHQKFKLRCQMLKPVDTKNYLKKLLSPDPLGSRSKPTVVGARRRCLGGPCAHAITPLEEPAPVLPGGASAA
jgi:hypothetical protein